MTFSGAVWRGPRKNRLDVGGHSFVDAGLFPAILQHYMTYGINQSINTRICIVQNKKSVSSNALSVTALEQASFQFFA